MPRVRPDVPRAGDIERGQEDTPARSAGRAAEEARVGSVQFRVLHQRVQDGRAAACRMVHRTGTAGHEDVQPGEHTRVHDVPEGQGKIDAVIAWVKRKYLKR